MSELTASVLDTCLWDVQILHQRQNVVRALEIHLFPYAFISCADLIPTGTMKYAIPPGHPHPEGLLVSHIALVYFQAERLKVPPPVRVSDDGMCRAPHLSRFYGECASYKTWRACNQIHHRSLIFSLTNRIMRGIISQTDRSVGSVCDARRDHRNRRPGLSPERLSRSIHGGCGAGCSPEKGEPVSPL